MATLVDGTISIATAGTEQQLTTTSTAVQWIMFAPHSDNTGQVFVGASTVVAAAGATARGARVMIPAATNNPNVILWGPLNLADIWIDAAVNTDGVSYLYLTV